MVVVVAAAGIERRPRRQDFEGLACAGPLIAAQAGTIAGNPDSIGDIAIVVDRPTWRRT
jgi:hypothetical protein